MASSFIPKGQEGLLLRSPLTFGFSPSANSHERKPIYSMHFDKSHMLGNKQRDILSAGAQPQKIGFYTRHNPHPARVRHFKGLNDVPICFVEDREHERHVVSAPGPSGLDYGPGYRPPGNMRYSAHSERKFPAVGIVPVTYAWRDELEKKANSAINRAMGHQQSRMGVVSGSGPRAPGQFDHLGDDKLLDMLCRILQTDSVPVCQAWLSSASDSEKNIVLNMIRMASTGELGTGLTPRPQTADSQVQYVWAPTKSHLRKPQHEYSYLSDDEDFNFSQNGAHFRETEMDQDTTDDGAAPFKFPENDTVIKTARQLSNLASRQSSRGGGERGMGPGAGWRFQHQQRQQFEGGVTDEERLAKIAAQLASSRQSQHSHGGSRGSHVRSASLSGPMLTGNRRSSSRRSRSKSANNAPVSSRHIADSYPPPPVKVHVTKETIRGSSAGSSSSGRKAQLRYTSHWDS